jgi:hypothetical protein
MRAVQTEEFVRLKARMMQEKKDFASKIGAGDAGCISFAVISRPMDNGANLWLCSGVATACATNFEFGC